MTREEIIQAISDDKTMPYIQPEQLAGIVDFVIKNYDSFLDTLPEQPASEGLEEAAEKDLVLTWEDIRTICLLTIGAEIVRDKPDLVDNVQEKLEQVFYEDVLRRFREMKKQITVK